MKPVPLVGAAALALYGVVRRRRLGRVTLALGALAIVALCVYGAGLVQLPKLENLIRDAGRTLGPYTYVLVGVMAFLETGAFVGLIAPGEFSIMVGGVVAGQGRISIVALIALVWACALAGDLVSFFAGRRLGREFMERHGARVKITPQRLDQVDRFFARHGGKAIFIGRFIGLVRAVAPFIAGSSRMPLRRFLPYDVLGAGLWGATYCLLGYVFWHSFDRLTAIAHKGALALGAVIVVVVGGIVAYRWLRRRENRRRARAWIDEQLDRPVLRPVVRAARPVVVPVARGLVAPAQFVWNRLTPGNLGLEFTALVAVAAVGGFAFGALADTVVVGPTRADSDAFTVVADLRSSFVTSVSKLVSTFGLYAVVGAATVLTAIALAWRRRLIEAVVLVAGAGLLAVASHLAKAAEDRPRPAGSLVETSSSSFPSGHALLSTLWVGIAVVVARRLRRRSAGAVLVAGSVLVATVIGLSRLQLRAHYLTDVLGGWALGAAVLAVCGCAGLVVAELRNNGWRA